LYIKGLLYSCENQKGDIKLAIFSAAALDTIGLFAVGGLVLLSTITVSVAAFVVMAHKRLAKSKHRDKKNER